MRALEIATHFDRPSMSRRRYLELSQSEKFALVVEDDLSLRPLWEHAFKQVDSNIEVDWATNLKESESLIRIRYRDHTPYGLVVADILLEGSGSGIDLWNRYGEAAGSFVLVSALPLSNWDVLKSLHYGLPLFLRKPLNLKKCIELIDVAFGPSRL